MKNTRGKIGLGIVGLGGRGVKFGGNTFAKHAACELVGLYDVDPDKITAAQRVLGEIPGTTSYEDFLALPNLDAVIICSPDHAHAKNAVPALKANKHVFCEKPMAQTIDDCDAMIAAWQESDVVFMIGLELRYCTLMQDMKKLIDAGEVGEIKNGIVVDNVSVGGNYYYHNAKRRQSFIKSLILEKGTHSLDLTNWLLGATPQKVYCSGGLDVFGGNADNDKQCRDCADKQTCPYYIDVSAFPPDYGTVINAKDLCVYAQECDVDDNSLLIVDYDTGARICYQECHFSPEYTREFTFTGTKGKIHAFYNNEQDFKITVWKRHARKQEIYFPERSIGGHGGGDEGIIKEFISRVQHGEKAMPGVIGARNSAAIAIAAHESSETGLPVEIAPAKATLQWL